MKHLIIDVSTDCFTACVVVPLSRKYLDGLDRDNAIWQSCLDQSEGCSNLGISDWSPYFLEDWPSWYDCEDLPEGGWDIVSELPEEIELQKEPTTRLGTCLIKWSGTKSQPYFYYVGYCKHTGQQIESHVVTLQELKEAIL